MLRFGVQFADGSKATNLLRPRPGPMRPPVPSLLPRGGGGGGATWMAAFWMHPLPPPGVLTFVCEWPAFDIPLTRCEVDAAPILEAAARAQIVFSEADLPEMPRPEPGT